MDGIGPPVATEPSERVGVTRRPILAEITALAEDIRERALEQRDKVTERDEMIRNAIDEFGCSYRQVALAAGLSSGRIHGILAND